MNRRLSRLTGLITRPLDRLSGPPQSDPNERPVEYNFALRCLAGICPKSILDVGPGLSPWPALLAHCGYQVTAIDEMCDYWRRPWIHNRHFYVHRDDITRPRVAGPFDAVTCISALEHIDDCDAAVRSILSLTRPGGYVVLTFPYNENICIADVYRLPGAGYGQNAPYICRVFSRAQVDGWLAGGRGSIVAQEYYQIFTGDLWTFGERVFPPRLAERADLHHLTAILIRKSQA